MAAPDTEVSWTLETGHSFGSDRIRCVCWSPVDKQWVAGGNNGKIETSPDGVTWSVQTSPFGSGGYCMGITWADGYYVAVGGSSTTRKIYYSTDAVTWNAPSSIPSVSGTMRSVAFGFSGTTKYWVAVGDGGTIWYTTTNPTGTWTNNANTGFSTTHIYDVVFGPNDEMWVAVGDTSKISYVANPSGTWTAATSGVSGTITSVIHNNNQFIAVATGNWSTTSADGITWSAHSSGQSGCYRVVGVRGDYPNGQTENYVLGVAGSANFHQHSTNDGVSFTAEAGKWTVGSPEGLATDGNGRYVAVGYDGSLNGRIYSGVGPGRSGLRLDAGTDTLAAMSFGAAVAVSRDGNYAFCGAYLWDDGISSQRGRVFVFSSPTDGKPIATLDCPADGYEPSRRFGFSVACSSDGSVVAVGTQCVDGSYWKGDVIVFSGTNWATVTTIRPSDWSSDVYGWFFGYSVDISDDGSVIVVGAPNHANGGTARGKVYVFSGTNWATETVLAVPSPADSSTFGDHVGISADGTVIGACSSNAPGGGTRRGLAFAYSGTNWGTRTALIQNPADVADSSNYGGCIALNSTGSVIAVSNEWCANGGKINVFSGSSWGTRTVVTPGDSPTATDGWGASVAFIDDAGTEMLVGAAYKPYVGRRPGAAYHCSGSSYATQLKYLPPEQYWQVYQYFASSWGVGGSSSISPLVATDSSGNFLMGQMADYDTEVLGGSGTQYTGYAFWWTAPLAALTYSKQGSAVA